MIYFIVLIVLIILVAPNFWVKHTIKKYSTDIPGIPGTGAELARHLIKRFDIEGVTLEKSPPGQDHYSSHEKVIRLSPNNYDGKSISAIAITVHEVGHAIQYHRKEKITQLREKYTPPALVVEKIAIALMGVSPLLAIIFKLPQLTILSVVAGLISLLISVALQLIILPMEWDASFRKALPIIIEGEYLSPDQIPAARKILKAAAMTYIAATLSSLLNVWRWLAILRR